MASARVVPRYRWTLWVLLVPVLLTGYAIGLWWLDRWSLGVAFDAYLAPGRVAANAAVGFVAMLALAAVTRRAVASMVLVSALSVLLFVASAIKLRLLGIPVVMQDMTFIATMDWSGLSLLSHYAEPSRIALPAIAGVSLVGVLFRFERPWCGPRSRVRLAALVVAAAALAGLYLAAWPWNSGWYGEAAVRPSRLGVGKGALHGGIVANILHANDVYRHQRFEVDKAALHTALRKLDREVPPLEAAPADGPLPDVVVVLSESFMDPRRLKGMRGVPDAIPAVRAEIVAGRGGTMQAPTFGGGTVRTEFEVLTGMPVDAFADVVYPYVDIDPAFLPSLVHALEARGYSSVAVHGNSGAFWNRVSAYRAMGFDRFLTGRDFKAHGGFRDGTWWSDETMTDIVLEQLQGDTGPKLVLALSIENHGPYVTDVPVRDPAARDAIALPPGLDPDAQAELRNYLYHLRHADREFARLLAALRDRGRPFALLFFGDHLPALANGTYDQLGFEDGQPASSQPVPWVLVDASGPSTASGPDEPIRAWELPAKVLQAAGVGGDAYFAFTARMGRALGAAGAGTPDPLLVQGLEAAAHARLADRFETDAR